MQTGEVEAVVYDEPLLRYTINSNSGYDNVVVLPSKFATQYYGFSLPKKSPLLSDINPVLLKEIRGVEWKAILREYDLKQ